jgi:uncharacterized protein involved in exopolysaccharide biosynthesis/Mrp family chromosome partitioning ATPase
VRPIAAENSEQAFFRLDLMRSLQLHRRLVIGCAVAGLVLGVAYYLFTWQVYLAQSVVYIQPAPPTVLQQPGGAARWPFDSGTYESYIAQQMLNVTRTEVLAGALHRMGHGSWWRTDESEQSAVERLRRKIEVVREGSSYQFSIGVPASNADLAASLANAISSSYLESATGEQKAGDAQRLTVLREERDRIQKELTADRAEQEALNKQLGQAAIATTASDHYDEDIARIRTDLVKARSDHDAAAARYTSVDAERGPSSAALDAEADELISTDAGLVSMKTSLNQRRAVLISQMANLTPNHPQYKQDAEELTKINTSLESMANDLRAKAAARIQLRLRGDLERTAAVEGKLNAQLGQLTGAAGDATSKLQRSGDLVSDIARLQTRFATVDDQWRNLMLEDGAPGSAFLTTPAVAPLHIAKSGALRNALVIIFAGLMFGIVGAIVSHKMDPTIYIAADVEQVLGFAPLAQLPDFSEVSDGVAEEHMLRLSTAIEYARKQGNIKSCIFTGTGPGTGVTTVVIRVREKLEAMGRATVLVDASGTPPPAPRANSAGNGQSGQTGLGLATTQRGSRPSALVQQMAEESETREGSLVLTDTAPLVVSAETEYLARFVDCAIVVIESGVTTRMQLRDVASMLQRIDVAAVGFVLNRVGLEKADPGFRLSVQAIEDHLNAQGRSQSRGTVRSQPSAVEDSVEEKQLPVKIVESAPPKPTAPSVAAEVKANLPPLRVQEHLFVPTEPSLVPPRTSRTSHSAQERVEPLPNPLPARPSWLGGIPPPAYEQQTKALPEPEIVIETQIAAAPASAEVPAVQGKGPLESVKIHEVQPAPVVSDEPRLKQGAAAGRAENTAAEDTPSHISSRFDGLRNLVTVLGLESARTTAVPSEPVARLAAKSDQMAERKPLMRASTTDLKPGPASTASASPRLVTAQPEFLPPKPVVPTEGDSSGEGGSSSRRDRWAGEDDVGILPSRRGQYKKK